jgi:hypothetical protein
MMVFGKNGSTEGVEPTGDNDRKELVVIILFLPSPTDTERYKHGNDV